MDSNTKYRSGELRELLSAAYVCAREGDFGNAEANLEEALKADFEDEEVISSLKCIHFWKERFDRFDETANDFEKGDFLLREWKAFHTFLDRVPQAVAECLYALRQWVFSAAFDTYQRFARVNEGNDPELHFRIGLCLKGTGDYQHAVEYLEKASGSDGENAGYLAELADCYAFLNEVRVSKVFFREAFYIDPQGIELQYLESLLIRRLIDEVNGKGYSEAVAREWIPVYGVIYGVFSVKRELRPLELGKLRQSIFALEKRIVEQSDEPHLVPRLINRYFWLIDHYISIKDSRTKIDEILNKIRDLDQEVYELYAN